MARLSIQTKFAYGIGQVGEGLKSRGFDVFVFFYFSQVLGLSGTLAGLAMGIAIAFDAITDPVAGSLSDNWRSPRGRRHPFMYAAAIPLALSWWALFFPPAGLGQAGLFSWLTAFAILVRGSMTLYHVPHLALGAELTTDYEERTTVVAYRTVAGMIGGIGATALATALFFPEVPEYEKGMLNPAGYPRVAVFGAAIMFLTIWYSAWGTRQHIPRLPKAPDEPQPFSFRRVWLEVRAAWRLRSFRSLLIGFSLFAISFGVTQTLQTHITVFFWEFTSGQFALLQLALGVSFAVGVILTSRVHARFDKKPTLIATSVVSSVLAQAAIILRFLGLIPENGTPELFWIVAGFLLLVGLLAGGAFTSAGSMMADVSEQFELQSGRGQQGILFSATSFANKLASGAGHVIAGVGLDLIAFPVQSHDPSNVAPELIRNLGLLNLTAALIGFTAIIAYVYYDITREQHQAALQELARRTASKQPDHDEVNPEPGDGGAGRTATVQGVIKKGESS